MACACLMVACAANAADTDFAKLVEDYWHAELERDPVTATAIGDLRRNDELPNYLGPMYRAQGAALNRSWLERAEDIERQDLSAQQRLSYDIFRYDRELTQRSAAFPAHLVPISQLGGFPTTFLLLGSGNSVQPFDTVEHYDDWLSRIDDAMVIFDQVRANLYEGLDRGVTQPRVILERTLPQLRGQVVDDVESSLFYTPIRDMPAVIGGQDRQRLRDAYRAAIEQRIIPAYRELADLVEETLIPNARNDVGWTSLPNGAAWYEYRIAEQTTTALTAEDIHQFGLAEVARIRGEMEGVMRTVGFDGDLPAFFTYVQEDDKFFFDSKEALIRAYEREQKRVADRLPKLFDIAPKTEYVIRPVEPFREKSAAGASYHAGSPDGSRPGVFYINTYNLRAQPRYGTETLTLHEASPGHHFQISVQQELEGLPEFRRFGGYTAFSEGWAMYAESLGPELGLFQDPYQYYGRLNDEMLRAMRLVVDTGLHVKGWSRARAIEYMANNSSLARSDIAAEVERYIANPAQALAYKVGERVIRGLRNEAEARLGDAFDVRAFHRQVLADGAMPMTVLKDKVRRWLDAESRRLPRERRTASAP